MVFDSYGYSGLGGPGLEGRAHQFLLESSGRLFDRKHSVDSAIAVSWASDDSFDGEGGDQADQDQGQIQTVDPPTPKTTRFIKNGDKTNSRQLGSGMTVSYDDGHRRASAPEYVCDSGGERKLQSILRSEPQVFKIYEKNQAKKNKKSKSKNNIDAESPAPQRRVGFNLPQGVKIPERVAIKTPGRVSVPIYRAKKTLGALAQKLTGGDRSEAVPWRPSPHVIPMQHQTKFKRSRKISPPSSTLPLLKRLTELKLKNLEELDELTKMEEFQSYVEQERKEKEEGDRRGSLSDENDGDSEVDDNSEEFESAAEATQDEEEIDTEIGEDGEKRTESDNAGAEEEEDEVPKYNRRKALKYHLKNINITEKPPTAAAPEPVKKSSRKVPSFPTGGHGLGHADRNHHLHKSNKCHHHRHSDQSQSQCQQTHEVCQACPVHHPEDPVDLVVETPPMAKKNIVFSPYPKKRLPFNYLNKKFNYVSSAASSDNESSSKEDDNIRSGQSSRANSVQMNENEILLNLATGGQGEGGSGQDNSASSAANSIIINGKPVKIINARYRRVPSFDLLPFVSTD